MENSFKENIKHIDTYSEYELSNIFNSVGNNVLIDKTVRVFNGKNINIGSNVRIDSYTILSSGNDGININNYIHIGPFSQLNGAGGNIKIENFCSISSRVSLFTASDDYSGGYMTGPMIPFTYRNISCGKIVLKKHCIIGCNTIVMPNVFLGEGCSVGACSFVNKNVPSGYIVLGNPCRKIGYRNLIKLDDLEEKFYEECKRNN